MSRSHEHRKLLERKKILTHNRIRVRVVKNSNYVRATSSKIGIFWDILKIWRGSVYKLLYADLLLYITCYYVIILTYRFVLTDSQKSYYEDIVKYCKNYSTFFPISFVLGFFVSTIMNRWWNQFSTIPRPTGLAVLVSASLQGNDEIGKALRRTIMRYVNCSITMVLRHVSVTVKRRFPTFENLVDAGLLNINEYKILSDINDQYPGNKSWVVPIIWATTITSKARDIGRIKNDYAAKAIIEEINKIRGNAGTLLNYISVNISLVYSQVVTIACYAYFWAALFGSQTWTEKVDGASRSYFRSIDFNYFPFFLILQFVFYMGWLKVAEENINPFGEDDDDFDVSSMIDSNLQMSFLIVDKMFDVHPIILKDSYWGEVPSELKDMAHPDTPPEPDTPNNLNNLDSVQVGEGTSGTDNQNVDDEVEESQNDMMPSLIDMPEELKGMIRVDTVDEDFVDPETAATSEAVPQRKVQFENDVELNGQTDVIETSNSDNEPMNSSVTNDIAPLVISNEDSKL